MLQARCGFPCPLDLRFLQTSLPSGIFTSLGIKAMPELHACRPAFQIRPIFVRSPQPHLLTRLPVEDHRSRSATPSEACCSLRPLGTFFTMPGDSILVNVFLMITDRFPQEVYLVFCGGC